jgi:hypothetical protein
VVYLGFPDLIVRSTPGAAVVDLPGGGWRLSIPPVSERTYSLAQLDDTMRLPRKKLQWQAPFTLEIKARVSAVGHSGTWGFGLWNDPFSFSMGQGGAARRLPALPNAAWFFYASEQNYLSLGDSLPANGLLAGIFSSIKLPGWALVPAVPLLPLLGWQPSARLLRRMGRRCIGEAAARLEVDPTAWHTYRMEWEAQSVHFCVDGVSVFHSRVSPRGRLGLVIWIDNQYAAFPPDGKLAWGLLANQEAAWMEVVPVEIYHHGDTEGTEKTEI